MHNVLSFQPLKFKRLISIYIKKYMPRNNTFKDYLERDVHDMT